MGKDIDAGPPPCEVCGGTDEEGCNFSMHEEHDNEVDRGDLRDDGRSGGYGESYSERQ